MQTLAAILATVHADWGVSDLRLLGEGLENRVFRANTRAVGPVAIRVPRERWYVNDNDQGLDARALLRQEALLSRHLRFHGVPVPAVFDLHLSDELDFLVSAFVESDGSEPDMAAVGRLTRAIHDCPVPSGFEPAGQGGGALAAVLAERIVRRLQVVGRLTGTALPAMQIADLHEVLRWPGARERILHMDMRPANLLTRRCEVMAVVDWSNALVGDPALELARIAEYGYLSAAFREGYGNTPAIPEAVELLYRLDTAVMLAVVFLSEAPDPVAARNQVARVAELCADWQQSQQLSG